MTGPNVSILEPARAPVLGGPPDADGSHRHGLLLRQAPDGETRLLERGRHAVGKAILAKLRFGPYLIDPVGFVMSRKVLKTIVNTVKPLLATPLTARPAPTTT